MFGVLKFQITVLYLITVHHLVNVLYTVNRPLHTVGPYDNFYIVEQMVKNQFKTFDINM